MIQFFWEKLACPASTVTMPRFLHTEEFLLRTIRLLQKKVEESSKIDEIDIENNKRKEFFTCLLNIDNWDSKEYRFGSLSHPTPSLGTQLPNAPSLEVPLGSSFRFMEGFVAYPKKCTEVNNTLILYLGGSGAPFDLIAPQFKKLSKYSANTSDYFDTKHFKDVPGINYAKATCFINYHNAKSHGELVNKIVRLVVPLLNTQKNYEEKNTTNNPAYFDNIIIFGFSLGGNLGSHVAHRLQIRFPRLPIQLVTYNSPRNGSSPFMQIIKAFIPDFLSYSYTKFKPNSSIKSFLQNLSTSLLIPLVLLLYLIVLVFMPFLTCIARKVLPSSISFPHHVSLNIEHDQVVGRQMASKYNIKLIKKPTFLDKNSNHCTPIYNCYIRSSMSILYNYLHGLKENSSSSKFFNVEALLNFPEGNLGVEHDSVTGEFFESYDSVISRLFASPHAQVKYEQSYVLCQAIEKIQRKHSCYCFFSKEEPLLHQLQLSMKELGIPQINRLSMSHLSMLKQAGVYLDQLYDDKASNVPLLDPTV